MSANFLIVGATGNTGKPLVEKLSSLIQQSSTFSDHRILALTRSRESPHAQGLSKLPSVEVIEQNWVNVDAPWLVSHSITRVFIAPHIQPNAFAEESQFYVNCLRAGIKYLVRIGTMARNTHADAFAYHSRSHWALENLLSQPEFAAMQWTSLQPHGFYAMFLAPAVGFIREYRKTGKQTGPLALMMTENGPFALLDASEVGVIAAHLLVKQDITRYNQARLSVHGSRHVTGIEVVKLVEQYIGEPVQKVIYKDLSKFDEMADNSGWESKGLMLSIKEALTTAWEDEGTMAITSKEVLEIMTPMMTPAEAMKAMLDE